MQRVVAFFASLVLILGFGVSDATPAQAAPPTATWRGTAGGDVASVDLSAAGIDLAGARLAVASSDSGSQLTPRSRSRSSNLGATIVGVPLSVVSNTVDAPPGGGPTTGTLLGLNVLSVVALSAMQTSNESHWSGDTACVTSEPLADSSVQTAGLAVGVPVVLPNILATGVSSTSGRTELVTGGSAYNRFVRSTASGQLAGLRVLNDIGITVAGTPSLVATSDGTAGGSSATYNNTLITVTRPDNSTVNLAPGASVTINVGLAQAVIRANTATSSVSGAGVVTSSVTVLTVSVTTLTVSAEINLLPLTANASAPSGGIDCPLPAPAITTPSDGDVLSDTTPTIAGTGVAGASVDLTIDGALVEDAATVSGGGTWSYAPGAPLAAGAHSVVATQSLGGSTSPDSNEVSFTIDVTAPAPPLVVTPANGSVISDNTPTVTGTAEPDSTVEVFIDGASIGTTTTSGGGNWSLVTPSSLSDGTHTVSAIASDQAGNDSALSNTNTFRIDAAAPAAPVVLTPANGSSTTLTTPTVTGTAEADSSVEVFIDGTSVGLTTAAGDGTWSLALTTPLTQGAHTVYAIATDEAGNDSPQSNTNTFTVDNVAPSTPVVVTPADGATVSDNTPTVTGTAEPDSIVEVFVDGTSIGSAVTNGSGTWSLVTPNPLADGSHTVNAVATDGAGNDSPTSNTNTFTVDTTAPAAPVVLTPANGSSTNDPTPAVTGTAEPNSTVEVFTDGTSIGTTTASVGGNWSLEAPTPLSDGTHTVNAVATDAAGNDSPTSNTNTFTVDTAAPAAPVVLTPANGSSTNDPTPTVAGTAEPNSTVEVFIDGTSIGTTTAAGDGTWTLVAPTPLSDGTHTVNALATDAAGNDSPTSNTNTFTVDTAAPAAPVVLTPANGSSTNDPTPTVTGTAEPNSTVEVFIDGTSIGTTTTAGDGTWTLVPTVPLGDGTHTVNAVATDAAGNDSPTSNTHTFTVDTDQTNPPTVQTPADGSSTSDNTPAVTGTAEPNSTVEVFIDGTSIGTTTAAGDGTWTLVPTVPLGDGTHTVNATATDAAGNESDPSATNTFAVDIAAPEAPVVLTPATGSQTADNTPTVTGTAEPNSTVEVFIDGTSIGSAITDGSGNWTIDAPTALADGTHTVNALATDAADNDSPTSNTNTFTVDTTAPTAPVVLTPADGSSTSDNTPAVTGTAEPNSTVEVFIDGTSIGSAITDGSGNWTIDAPTALADGTHTVNALATDAADNDSPTSNTNTFYVDTAAPNPPTVVTPEDGSTTADTTPMITGTAEANSTVEVIIDDTSIGTTSTAGDGTWTLDAPTALADGTHTVNAVATDAAGNESDPSNTNTFTVDATAPATPVIVRPAEGAAFENRTPTITGTADLGTTVEVVVDGTVIGTTTTRADGTWSIVPPRDLSVGSHTVTAYAIDAVGNRSEAAAPVTFRVISRGGDRDDLPQTGTQANLIGLVTGALLTLAGAAILIRRRRRTE